MPRGVGLAAVALAAAVAGWAGAAAMLSDDARPAPTAAIVTVDDAPEALEPEPPVTVDTAPPPAAPAAATPAGRGPAASAPSTGTTAVPTPAPSRRRSRAATTDAAVPATPATPEADEPADTAPSPTPVPRPTPTPSPAPAVPSVTPYVPPPTARIPAGALTDLADSVATLRRARAAAGPGSAVADDITWLLRLYELHRDDPAPGRRATVVRAMRVNAWWYGTHAAPRQRVILRDPDGVLATYRGGHGFAVNPVATTGRWRDLNTDLTPEQLAEPLLQMAVPRDRGAVHALVWEYYDVPEEPDAVRPGVSGMAQGRMAELLANAYHRTGQARFAAAAEGALAAMDIAVPDGGVRSTVAWPRGTATHPWFVERAYPGADPLRGAALNGFMVSVLSLRATAIRLDQAPEVEATTSGDGFAAAAPTATTATTTAPAPPAPRDPVALRAAAHARSLAQDGVETLRAMTPAHDTGTWSLYSLVSPGRADGTYLADLNYHCYHVHLLRALATGFDDAAFARTADRWEGYVRARGAICPER